MNLKKHNNQSFVQMFWMKFDRLAERTPILVFVLIILLASTVGISLGPVVYCIATWIEQGLLFVMEYAGLFIFIGSSIIVVAVSVLITYHFKKYDILLIFIIVTLWLIVTYVYGENGGMEISFIQTL